MRCIAVINQKGGVGKTTTTVNLGAALARRGQKVLLLDLDPQGNLSLHIDRQPQSETETTTWLLLEEQPLAALVQSTSTEGLYVVPADSSLGGVEQVLANKIGREMILRDALEAYDGDPPFDFVLLDCPPSLGVLSANALVAAGEVLIPMQAEYFSLQGMAKLTEIIELVRSRLNPALQITSVLPCMYDSRTRLTAEVLSEIREHFGTIVADFPIRANVKLAEAPSFGRTIFEHDPECNGALDYASLACDVLGIENDVFEIEDEEEEEAEPADEESGAWEAEHDEADADLVVDSDEEAEADGEDLAEGGVAEQSAGEDLALEEPESVPVAVDSPPEGSEFREPVTQKPVTQEPVTQKPDTQEPVSKELAPKQPEPEPATPHVADPELPVLDPISEVRAAIEAPVSAAKPVASIPPAAPLPPAKGFGARSSVSGLDAGREAELEA